MTETAFAPSREDRSTETTASLFELHAEEVLAYCLRQLGCRAEAEDAVQTTFVYALRALRRGVVPECEAAWLIGIAKNVCRWQRRTASRRAVVPDVDLDRIGLAPPDDDERELLMGLREALHSIPESQRKALVLREWHGMPSREIASELGLSATATHALLTRARRSLALALTAAQRPALGLFGLLLEFRAQIKALLGGAFAKAAVVTVAVVGGGSIGGVAVLEGGSDPKSSTPARTTIATELERADAAPARDQAAPSTTRGTTRPQPARVAARGGPRTAMASTVGFTSSASSDVPVDGADPGTTAGPPPTQPASPDSPSQEPAALPKHAPPVADVLPDVGLPPVELPPAELPPVELPPLDLPSADLSPVVSPVPLPVEPPVLPLG